MGCNLTLYRECRHDFGNYRAAESEIFHEEVGNPAVLEVPEHTFGKSRQGGAHTVGELHCYIIAGEHDFVDALKHLGLVVLHPFKLGGGEVAGRV